MTIDYSIIGKRIKEIRLHRRISQATLSEMIGVSPTYISYIEKGAKKLSVATLVNIANALGVSADSILASNLLNCRCAYNQEVEELFSCCSAEEAQVITDTIKALKVSLKEQLTKIIYAHELSGNPPRVK